MHGDRDLLLEAVANLVDNAVKFTPKGGRVEVALVRGERESVVRVTDTGPGISESERRPWSGASTAPTRAGIPRGWASASASSRRSSSCTASASRSRRVRAAWRKSLVRKHMVERREKPG